MKKIDDYTGIRNFVVKTVLALMGLYFVFMTGHKHVSDTCNGLPWLQKDTYLVTIGFILAVGAAFYNRILDAILKKIEK